MQPPVKPHTIIDQISSVRFMHLILLPTFLLTVLFALLMPAPAGVILPPPNVQDFGWEPENRPFPNPQGWLGEGDPVNLWERDYRRFERELRAAEEARPWIDWRRSLAEANLPSMSQGEIWLVAMNEPAHVYTGWQALAPILLASVEENPYGITPVEPTESIADSMWGRWNEQRAIRVELLNLQAIQDTQTATLTQVATLLEALIQTQSHQAEHLQGIREDLAGIRTAITELPGTGGGGGITPEQHAALVSSIEAVSTAVQDVAATVRTALTPTPTAP